MFLDLQDLDPAIICPDPDPSTVSLKVVLSSEMDPAESRLIREDFIKGNVRQVFRKIPHSPIK
jgi:hypothetical protein